MLTSLHQITILATFLLTSCVSLTQEMPLYRHSLSWMEYESMDEPSRQARIGSFKRELGDCSRKSHCADLHYQLAMVYLSAPAPSRKALDTADRHLQQAAQEAKYQQHALLLRKVLRGWIHEADQNVRLAKQVKKLELSLERAKAVDLEKIGED